MIGILNYQFVLFFKSFGNFEHLAQDHKKQSEGNAQQWCVETAGFHSDAKITALQDVEDKKWNFYQQRG